MEMNKLSATEYTSSLEECENVAARLKSLDSDTWSGVPDYQTKDHRTMVRMLDQVYDTVKKEVNGAYENGVDEAYEKSRYFIDNTYNLYNGKKKLDRDIHRVFLAPMFSSRHDEEHIKESLPFLPLFDRNRYATKSDVRMRTVYKLPATVLDTNFKSDNDQETGAFVLTPLFRDLARDILKDKRNANPVEKLIEVRDFILEDTANFVHKKLGAKVLGLGATLPSPAITNFGQVIKNFDGMEDLVTTTGHGGTVYMIVETIRKIMQETSVETHGKLGVIGGAGSIGRSSTATMIDMLQGHEVYTYDTNEEKLNNFVNNYDERDKIHVVNDALEVIKNTNIIVSAVTVPIDLDAIDPQCQLDLRGKVIVDDSQPACFDSEQVRARGGHLVWIVGEDGSESEFMTRDGLYTNGIPYDYGGDKSGLYGEKSEFACSLETASIARLAAYHEAISRPVEPGNVRKIGALMRSAGVRVAPFQAYGRSVEIQ